MTEGTKKFQIVFKNGAWHTVPEGTVFIEGTSVEINVDESSIVNEALAKKSNDTERYKIFDVGCELLVALKKPTDKTLSIDELDVFVSPNEYNFAQYSHLSGYFNVGTYSLISITLKRVNPSSFQAKTHPVDSGGWFVLTSTGKFSVSCGVIELPDSLGLSTPKSLNHAYTLLSEKIELDRLSHTGNIYKLVFYKEDDGKWYPLEKLRNPSKLDPDSSVVSKLWVNIRQKNFV